jgi:predicted dehydrogenase
MARKPIRLGIVGGGFGAYGIAAACRRSGAFDPVAIAVRDLAKAKVVADRSCISRVLGDAQALIASPDIEAIAIAVPPPAQEALALAAFAAGKPVLAEKPLATDLATARRMAAAARAVPNMIDFLFPEIAAWRRAEAMLAAGEIGTIRHVVVDWRSESHDVRNRISSWKTDPRLGGGALAHMASHAFHYLERFCGPAGSLQAHLSGLNEIPNSETAAFVALAFASGATANVTVSTSMPLAASHSVTFYGSDGSLELSAQGPDPVGFRLLVGRRSTGSIDEIAVPQSSPPLAAGEDPRCVPLAALLDRFAEWVADGKAAAPTFADGARVQMLIDGAQSSNRSGTRVLI